MFSKWCLWFGALGGIGVVENVLLQPERDVGLWEVAMLRFKFGEKIWITVFLFVCLFFSELKELIQVLGEDVQSLDTTITSPGSALDTPSQMLLKTSTAKAKVNRV